MCSLQRRNVLREHQPCQARWVRGRRASVFFLSLTATVRPTRNLGEHTRSPSRTGLDDDYYWNPPGFRESARLGAK
jgi:hypothetical protein